MHVNDSPQWPVRSSSARSGGPAGVAVAEAESVEGDEPVCVMFFLRGGIRRVVCLKTCHSFLNITYRAFLSLVSQTFIFITALLR